MLEIMNAVAATVAVGALVLMALSSILLELMEDKAAKRSGPTRFSAPGDRSPGTACSSGQARRTGAELRLLALRPSWA